MGPRITRYLQNSHGFIFSGYAIFAAFMTYFSMYAFRKPFSVAIFEGHVLLPGLPALDYKILLIISQVMGYTLSKFYGIKFVSEISGKNRATAIALLIGIAELSLLLFAIVPAPFNAFFLFINGIPLGMIWGLVFGFLEGRKFTEALGAGLSASFIIASGVVKSIGKFFLDMGISEFWMPFFVGLVFLPIIYFFVWMLKLLPEPTAEDERLRTKREPMNSQRRREFLALYFPGIFFLTILYMFLTAYRDFRDNFAREIWAALGFSDPSVFTVPELVISFGVLLVLGLMFKIKKNKTALFTIIGIMILGAVMIGFATFAFQKQWISGYSWMLFVGLGLYIAYVPYGCIVFERMIATLGFVGTAGFLIYITDAFGYLGSVFLLLYKNFGTPNLSWLDFFIKFSYITSIVAIVFYLISLIYFMRKLRVQRLQQKNQNELTGGNA